MRQAIALVVMVRIALGAVGWFTVAGSPEPAVTGEWPERLFPAGSVAAGLVQPWARWDSFWYAHIAASGYRPGREDVAFFPVFPALEAMVGRLLGGQYVVAGLVISSLAMVVALVLLHRLVAADTDPATARRAIAFTALAPVAFFFLAPYAESLFLALSVGAFLAARRRHWAPAGALGLLAALTRPAGALLVAPLLVEAILDARRRRRQRLRPLRAVHLYALAPVVGLAAWDAYARLALAVPEGIAGAARHWGQHPAAPWQAIDNAVRATVAGTPEEWLNLAAVVGLAGAVLYMWGRLPPAYTAYAAVMLVPLTFREAATTPLASDARYSLVVFPLFVALAVAARRRWVHVAVVAVFEPLLVVLFVLYAAYDFIG